MKKLLMMFGFLVLLVACGNNEAKFPAKNITLVVPYSPGGASDTATRIYGQALEKDLGVPVVVENRTGGAGAVGLSFVQNSKSDGYTIGYIPVEASMIEALGYVQLKPADFNFLGGGTIVPSVLTVRSDSPWKTYEEFIAYAQENPTKIRIGNSGPGSIWHLAAAALAKKENTKFTHIPFDGGATAVAALLGSHIEAVTVSETEVFSGVLDGTLKILVSMGKNRSESSPEVLTLTEKGIDLIMAGWGGFATPAGLSPSVLETLVTSSEKILQSDDFKTQVLDRGLAPGYQSASDMQIFAQEQYEFFKPLIKEMGLTQ